MRPAARGVPTYVRVAVLALCVSLASHADRLSDAAPWFAVFLVLAGVAWWARWAHPTVRATLITSELATLGLGISVTGGGSSPLLPYLLAPLFAAGFWFGNAGVLYATVAAASFLTLLRFLAGVAEAGDAFMLGQWLLLGAGGGLLAAWGRRLQVASLGTVDDTDVHYERARELLSELSLVARKLPGALDPSSAADAVLDELATVAPYDSAAVLTGYGGEHVVPVAIRGLQRVPWRGPHSHEGPLWEAWEHSRTVVDVRRADGADGRRRDSTLVVVPLRSQDGEPFGLVAFERRVADAYEPAIRAIVEELLTRHATRLEIALLFADLRHTATLEERERLAREMHDGVAQDLAYFGFELDSLKSRVAKTAPQHAEAVADLRRKLTRMIAEIRVSITDLRSTVTPERGLGTILSSYLRAAAGARGLTVHLSTKESGFRLPSDHEMLLFRAAQRFAAVATHSEGAQNLWVSLEADPPHGFLVLEHDGSPAASNAERQHDYDLDEELQDLRADAENLGWELCTSQSEAGFQRLDVRRRGDSTCQPISSSRTITHSSGRA